MMSQEMCKALLKKDKCTSEDVKDLIEEFNKSSNSEKFKKAAYVQKEIQGYCRLSKEDDFNKEFIECLPDLLRFSRLFSSYANKITKENNLEKRVEKLQNEASKKLNTSEEFQKLVKESSDEVDLVMGDIKDKKNKLEDLNKNLNLKDNQLKSKVSKGLDVAI